MNLGVDLNLQQTQKLIMTPELKQAIKILRYNSQELCEFINEELLTNPILEKKEETLEKIEDNSEVSTQKKTELEFEERIEKIDWKQLSDNIQIKSNTRKFQENSNITKYDNYTVSKVTLHDHLLSQLQYTSLDELRIPIANYLIYSINSSGYLHINDDYVKEHFKITTDTLEEIIQTIQTFDPIGIGARDIVECLLIQTAYSKVKDKRIISIISNHLEDVASNRLAYIAKVLDITIEEVKEAIKAIRRLEPKPGRAFDSLCDTLYIKPDVTLKKTKEGYNILVNEITAPSLCISSFYEKMLAAKNVNAQTTEYITMKLQSALRITRSIEQRRNTIYRVVNAIVEHQCDFFKKGTIHLKTLTLRDIADKIDVHESTVSRAINGKYIQCQAGLFELKYFFQSGVNTNVGGNISSESIKVILKEMIEKEDKNKPLSDQVISLDFDKNGIKISRRTIAKYRKEIGIQSTSKRKEY